MREHAFTSIFWGAALAGCVLLTDNAFLTYSTAVLVFFYTAAFNFVADVRGDTIKLLKEQLEFAHEQLEGLREDMRDLQGVVDDQEYSDETR